MIKHGSVSEILQNLKSKETGKMSEEIQSEMHSLIQGVVNCFFLIFKKSNFDSAHSGHRIRAVVIGNQAELEQLLTGDRLMEKCMILLTQSRIYIVGAYKKSVSS